MSQKRFKSHFLEFEYNFDVVGIHSINTPHYLAWCLNDTFSSNFQLHVHSFALNLLEETASEHAEFYWEGDETHSEMWLVSNRGSAGLLYTGKPTPDFWLIIRDADIMGGTADWIRGMKAITNVQMVFKFPAEQLEKLPWLQQLSHL